MASEPKEEKMKRSAFVALAALAMAGGLTAGGGGPDAFGYRWLDSDSTGGPAYRWEPLARTQGTQILGLGDDNVVGPFSIGFNSSFYWLLENSVYVGSNGYVAYNDNSLLAAPFPNLPNLVRPNSVLAPLMADLDFTGVGNPAKAFYWTSSTDTFIVEFDSVPYWSASGPVGANSFQVVAFRRPTDTLSFFFMYRHVDVPPLGWADSTSGTSIGIENVAGAVGLSYMHNGSPFGNQPHDELAVRFFPPRGSTYQSHDMSVWRLMNDWNGGVFLRNGLSARFWAKTRNTGNMSETNIPVYCQLRDSTGTLVLADTYQRATAPPGSVDSFAFVRTWTPTTDGVYTLRVITNLTGDRYRRNDTLPLEVRVVTYPAEFGYDRGAASGFVKSRHGPGGYANRFKSPGYPVQVTGVKAFLQASPSAGCTMFLFSEVAGRPGVVLGRGVLSGVGAAGWYQVDFFPPVTVSSGGFFAGVTSSADSALSYGYDDGLPISRQAWAHIGSWAPAAEAPGKDLMIRALVRAPAAADVGVTRILAPLGAIDSGTVVTPACSVYNYGIGSSSYRVRMRIGGFYNDTARVTGHAAGSFRYLTFPAWPAHQVGNHAVACSTELTGDEAPDNDRARDSVVVRPLTGAEERPGLPPQFEFDCRPNPVTDISAISFALPAPCRLSIRLYDVTGKLVSTLAKGYHSVGEYSYSLLTARHSPGRGVYLLEFESEGLRTTRKLVIE